ncbi:MAG: hypothetical protein KC496_11705 [Anaerolineae bacterium]|nr:hypothetical protein [Anaerolineae bacterium]
MKLRLLILVFFLGACGTNDTRLTLEANHIAAGTQVADLRLTATVQQARARTTVDAVQTDAALAATQSQFLEATLIALDMPAESVATFRAQMLVSQPTPQPTDSPQPNTTPSLIAAEGSDAQGGNTPTPTIPGITPLAPTQNIQVAVTTADPDALRLENPTTATGVDDNGCAVDSRTQFSTNAQEIYIIARAFNLPASGVMFEARWFREGQAIGPVYTYSPDQAVDSLCIWFFVDQTDFTFTPGNYSVVLTINGSNAFEPIPFQITTP